MKRLVTAALALALFGLAAPANSSAQAIIEIGGALTLPAGDYNVYAKPGWLGHAGVVLPVGDAGLSVGGHGYYGVNKHDDVDGDKTNLYGALASVGMAFGEGNVTPQIFALVGSMTHSYKSEAFPTAEGSATSLAAGGGVQIGFPLGGVTGSIGGWFITGFSDNSDTRILGIDLGVGIPVGGGM